MRIFSAGLGEVMRCLFHMIVVVTIVMVIVVVIISASRPVLDDMVYEVRDLLDAAEVQEGTGDRPEGTGDRSTHAIEATGTHDSGVRRLVMLDVPGTGWVCEGK